MVGGEPRPTSRGSARARRPRPQLPRAGRRRRARGQGPQQPHVGHPSAGHQRGDHGRASGSGWTRTTMLAIFNASSGRSGSTENKWPNFIVPETFDSGFGLRLMLKDMRIATGLAEQLNPPSRVGQRAVHAVGEAARRCRRRRPHRDRPLALPPGAGGDGGSPLRRKRSRRSSSRSAAPGVIPGRRSCGSIPSSCAPTSTCRRCRGAEPPDRHR